LIRVLAAVVNRGGKYLICQRPLHKRHGGLWEFPGGKIELRETDLEAAQRELSEELGVSVSHVSAVVFSSHDTGSEFVIDFLPVQIDGEPICLEHSALAWVRRSDLSSYDLAPSDRKFVNYLQSCALHDE
jgi:8-oxo-dGTP diphosphatase